MVIHHLYAETFMASHSALSTPPRLTGSKHIGHNPSFDFPMPLVNLGVYKSYGSRGSLICAEGAGFVVSL